MRPYERTIMDPTSEAFFTAAFGKEIAKSFTISAATTVGMLVGMFAVGYVIGKVNEKRQKTTPATTA